jgi:hypothetical protein
VSQADGLSETGLEPVPEGLLKEAQQAAEEQKTMPGVDAASAKPKLSASCEIFFTSHTRVLASALFLAHNPWCAWQIAAKILVRFSFLTHACAFCSRLDGLQWKRCFSRPWTNSM